MIAQFQFRQQQAVKQRKALQIQQQMTMQLFLPMPPPLATNREEQGLNQLLKEDHSRKPNRKINKRRADEFGVNITQIETWHKRQRQQSRD